MKIVINKIPIIIKKQNYDFSDYNFDEKIDKIKPTKTYKGVVFVGNTSKNTFIEVLKYVIDNNSTSDLAFVVEAKNRSKIKKFISKDIKVISAGGGVVSKKNKILMIFRLGKWDLPKGKMEKGESKKETAAREVEEECGVKVLLDSKIMTTYHYYFLKNKFVIKQTYWYNMTCLDDSDMLPQAEEGIEKVEWKNKKEVEKALKNTFPNIKLVLKKHFTQ